MFTSHTINSCKKMLHDYYEFNNFIDHMLANMEEEINEESNNVDQKDKEVYENIKTIRSELESLHKELKISIAARNEEKTMQNLTITLKVLKSLQQEFEKAVEEGLIEFLFNLAALGINHLHSIIERIVSKSHLK
jgi:hypothetical protein